MTAKSDWVRVRSESELRPGMTVMRRYSKLGDWEMRLVERADAPYEGCWDTSNHGLLRFLRPTEAIKRGALYRLRDLDEADETTEDARTKERVTT